jgi:type I restriction enzyme S subunit
MDGFYDGLVTKLSSLKRVRVTDQERTLFALRPGDVLVNRVNSREYLGKSALVHALTEPTIFESNMMRIGIDETRADPGFVVQFLQTAFAKEQILRASKDLLLYLPPLAQQRQFMDFVSVIVKVRASLRRSRGHFESTFAALLRLAFEGGL